MFCPYAVYVPDELYTNIVLEPDVDTDGLPVVTPE
jgi:hypothetical protein